MAVGNALDVADAVGVVANQVAAVVAIGGAVLSIIVIVRAYRWVRGAMAVGGQTRDEANRQQFWNDVWK